MERSRESPSTPTSFSTCTMITRWVRSTSRMCRIRAAKARASACTIVRAQRGEHLDGLAAVDLGAREAVLRGLDPGGSEAGEAVLPAAEPDPDDVHVIPAGALEELIHQAEIVLALLGLDPVPRDAGQDGVEVDLAASSGHTTFMRSVSDETVLSVRRRAPGRACHRRSTAWPGRVFPDAESAAPADLVCARATRASAARQQCAGRNLTLIMLFSFKISFHRHVPDIGAARLAGGALDFEDDGVVSPGFVLVHGILFGGGGAVAEVPFPGR